MPAAYLSSWERGMPAAYASMSRSSAAALPAAYAPTSAYQRAPTTPRERERESQGGAGGEEAAWRREALKRLRLKRLSRAYVLRAYQ